MRRLQPIDAQIRNAGDGERVNALDMAARHVLIGASTERAEETLAYSSARLKYWKSMQLRSDQDRERIYQLRRSAHEAMRYCEYARAQLDEAVIMLRLADQMERPLLGEKRE